MTVPPYQELLFPPDPAVGADFSYTVKGDTRVVLVSVMCELAASAAVGNRGVSLQFFNWNAQRFLVAGTAATVAPGTTQAFCWQSAASAGVWAVDDAALAGIPEVMLLPGCVAKIHVTGLDAGDQLSQVALLTDQYPPASDEPGPVPYPLLDAEAFEAIAKMEATMHDLVHSLDRSQVEARRDRLQREALALRGG